MAAGSHPTYRYIFFVRIKSNFLQRTDNSTNNAIYLMTHQELEKYLWGAAKVLRGTIDAGDYKQYIFPLLCFKRICSCKNETAKCKKH